MLKLFLSITNWQSVRKLCGYIEKKKLQAKRLNIRRRKVIDTKYFKIPQIHETINQKKAYLKSFYRFALNDTFISLKKRIRITESITANFGEKKERFYK